MPNFGVNAAILEGESILLTLREDFEVWCLPGGSVETGESLADAAHREVREEIGLEIDLIRLVGTYSRLGWMEQHVCLFAARLRGGALALDPHEVLAARFFPLTALPEYLLMSHGEQIQDVISGVTGVVKTTQVTTSALPSSRAELYALRDQSGLSRREFYQRYVDAVSPDEARTDVKGCQP